MTGRALLLAALAATLLVPPARAGGMLPADAATAPPGLAAIAERLRAHRQPVAAASSRDAPGEPAAAVAGGPFEPPEPGPAPDGPIAVSSARELAAYARALLEAARTRQKERPAAAPRRAAAPGR